MSASREKIRIKYYEDNMTKFQHILAYIVYAIAIGAIFYIYYHILWLSVVGGLIIAIPQEKIYSKSVMKKRQSKLRVQFSEFLDIISISISGGAGRSMENAVKDSISELRMLFSEKSDIVREIELIVSDYERAGIPMKEGFLELGKRSELEDIISFATVYATIEGKTSDFGYIITQTHDIIKEKLEITMEIETNITSAKSEAYQMLVLPLILIIVMGAMGGGLMDTLFQPGVGRIAATVGLVCTLVSYVIATKATEIEV